MVFAMPHLSQAQVFGSPAPETPGFGSKNQHLKTLLELQYHMQLLKRLIEHERSVNQIVQAAIQIGLNDPLIPVPDYNLCAQVPANIPCAQAYDDLYQDFSVARNTLPAIPILTPSLNTASAPLPAEEITAYEPAVVAAGINLYWTDITCLADKCTAIVSPDVRDPRARYRIHPGKAIPGGGVIETISAAGVAIRQDDRLIRLEPAPSV